MWGVAITDLNSAVRAVVDPYDMQLTRRLNSYASITFKVSTKTEGAAELKIAERAVKAYRNGILRFYGQISEPLTDDQDFVSVVAHDPLFFAGRRRLPSSISFTSQDAGQIAWSLLNTQNTRSSLHLRQGTIAPSVARDRSYIAGDEVGKLILQLAEVDEGFYFLAQPVDNVPGVFAEFEVRWPNPGGSALSAVFSYGNTLTGNLSGFQRDQKLPLNRVRALGAEEGEFILTADREDATSISRFGLLEDDRSFSTVVELTTLDQHALEELEPEPPTTYEVTMLDRSDIAINNVFVPTLFDDFDVGDAVRLRILNGRVDVNAAPRVAEASVQISDAANIEHLSSVFMVED